MLGSGLYLILTPALNLALTLTLTLTPTCRLSCGLHPGERVVQVGGEAGDDLGRCRRPCGRRTGEIALLSQSMQLKHVRTGRLNRPDHGRRHAKHGCVNIREEVVRRSGAQQCAKLIDHLA